ncbi:MAG: hypothetical protein F6J97_18840 [Leptolyngbya sp. SIO4C1]|nr:hypothetical protein [Leptolyngbya sp. SIO4C1]
MTTLAKTQTDRLFTDLGAEAASTITGGFRFRVNWIKARDVNDRGGVDEPILKLNGRRIWPRKGVIGMRAGQFRFIGRTFTLRSSPALSLFEYDNTRSGKRYDQIGRTIVTALPVGNRKDFIKRYRFSGRGASYTVSATFDF